MKNELNSLAGNGWSGNTAIEHNRVEVRPYNLKEICLMYKMSYKSMHTCLAPVMKDIGKKPGRFFTVHQVERIFKHLGLPYTVIEH